MDNKINQIKILGLNKEYNSQGKIFKALDNINLNIDKGDIFGIIGSSGAGKSTLLRCINKLESPTDGHIYIDNKNILSMNSKDLKKIRKKIAMIFQSFNLLMQKNVISNIMYPLELEKTPKKEAISKAIELLKIVGLEEKKLSYPSQLSGGQKQRVAIARALACNPEILLCDEPTSALDPITTQSILDLLYKINKSMGITIIIITHEISIIRKICNKVAILENGSLMETGFVNDVFINAKSKSGKKLFGIIDDTNTINKEKAYLRIIFDGENESHQPIISKISRELNIDINIISADIKQFDNQMYGQMLIDIPNNYEEELKLKNEFKKYNIKIGEVTR